MFLKLNYTGNKKTKDLLRKPFSVSLVSDWGLGPSLRSEMKAFSASPVFLYPTLFSLRNIILFTTWIDESTPK